MNTRSRKSKTWNGRYILLIFDCLLVVGIYFCTDIPSALQTLIETPMTVNCTETVNVTCCNDCLGLGSDQYNLLYTIYSWTSAAMLIPVGFVIDRMGNRLSALVFTGIATSGALVFAVGSLPSVLGTEYMFPVMMIGRLLLGAGTGSSRIVRDRIIACWFPDKLALAFGIAVSTMGMGSVLTFLLTSNLAVMIGLRTTLFVGAGVCSTCFLSAIVVSFLDWYGSSRQSGTVVKITEKSATKLSDIREFPASFWLIAIMVATYYSFQLPFTANGSKFLHTRYDLSKTHASYINGAIYDVSVALSPLVGFLLDKFGNRGWVACLGAAVTVPVGPLLLFTDMPAVIGYVVLGVTFTFTVVSLWSSIPHVVPPSVLGAANGIASCMLDLTVGLTSLVVGKIMSATKDGEGETTNTGWKYVFLLIFGQATLCTVTGVLLNVVCRKDGKINERAHLRRSGSFGPVHYPSIIKRQMKPDGTDNMEVIIENDADKEWKKFSSKKSKPATEESEGTDTTDVQIYVNNANIQVWATQTDSGSSVNVHCNTNNCKINTSNGLYNGVHNGAPNTNSVRNGTVTGNGNQIDNIAVSDHSSK